jgi:osmoprotectant transport system substrate-binding protein
MALGLVGAVVLSAGLVIGLGTGAASAGHIGDSTATTVATVPEPVVTSVAEPAATTEVLPGKGKPVIRIGDMNTPEQFIIGALYEVALEHQGYKVYVSRNVNAPSQVVGGLHDGSLDLYPEYLGVWNSAVAHLHSRFRTFKASFAAAGNYARHNGYVLLAPTPFSDTSCVAVLAQYAQANGVNSLPELARGQPISFGAPLEFQTLSDGLPALEQSYHLKPDYVQRITDGYQYWWLRTGNVQAAYCSTTDPLLAGTKYVALRDPKHIFGHGNVVAVTTGKIISDEGPAYAHTIERVDSLLTLSAMRGLNAEDEQGHHDPGQIAKQFLEGNGVLPPSRYAPVPTATSTAG